MLAAVGMRTAASCLWGDKTSSLLVASPAAPGDADCGWVVRMRLFEECLQHGPQGASYSLGWLAPCIGSHYLVRTKHLKAVGGIGPELVRARCPAGRAHGGNGGCVGVAHGDSCLGVARLMPVSSL